MPRPRYSVVIPTRERPDTLRHALQTCLDLDYDDYEIVVSDNCGSPATRAVVEAANSPRVRYLRSDRPLAMSANWERAVDAAWGEYVTVLGDDNGLLPHALRMADRLFAMSGLPVLRWDIGVYYWPDHHVPAWANGLEFPLKRDFHIEQGPTAIRAVLDGQATHTGLPMIYNSFIHHEVLATIRRSTGRLFGSMCPDIYSGFTVAFVAGQYGFSELPLSVFGASKAATGGNVLFNPQSPVSVEFWKLNREVGLDWHPDVPRVVTLPTLYADSLFHAQAGLIPRGDPYRIDPESLARQTLAAYIGVDEPDWQQARQLLAESLASDPAARERFQAHAASLTPRFGPRSALPGRYGFAWSPDRFCVNGSEFGLQTIADVTRFLNRVFGLTQHEAELATLSQRLTEAERELQTRRDQWQAAATAQQTLDQSLSCWPYRLVRSARAWVQGSHSSQPTTSDGKDPRS